MHQILASCIFKLEKIQGFCWSNWLIKGYNRLIIISAKKNLKNIQVTIDWRDQAIDWSMQTFQWQSIKGIKQSINLVHFFKFFERWIWSNWLTSYTSRLTSITSWKLLKQCHTFSLHMIMIPFPKHCNFSWLFFQSLSLFLKASCNVFIPRIFHITIHLFHHIFKQFLLFFKCSYTMIEKLFTT